MRTPASVSANQSVVSYTTKTATTPTTTTTTTTTIIIIIIIIITISITIIIIIIIDYYRAHRRVNTNTICVVGGSNRRWLWARRPGWTQNQA